VIIKIIKGNKEIIFGKVSEDKWEKEEGDDKGAWKVPYQYYSTKEVLEFIEKLSRQI